MNVLEAQGNGALYAPAVNSNYFNLIVFIKMIEACLISTQTLKMHHSEQNAVYTCLKSHNDCC